VNLYSTNAIASQIIAQIKIPNPIVLKKASFLSACEGSAGKSQPVFTYGGDSAKLIETKVESINLATGPVSAQYSLFLAQVTIGSQRVEANIKIWSSLKTPGLILKQIFVLTNVPIVGQATVMDELISQ
ncbi:MAG: hypothetical protein NTV34_12690, partial [Proteobacteria bacterium]|nr:hypothetical protein [Pseudomonadota bacterium]